MMFHQKVITPFGEGIVQGMFAVRGDDGVEVVNGIAVQLPINDETRLQLGLSSCMTPRAELNGVWVFQESELQVKP